MYESFLGMTAYWKKVLQGMQKNYYLTLACIATQCMTWCLSVYLYVDTEANNINSEVPTATKIQFVIFTIMLYQWSTCS